MKIMVVAPSSPLLHTASDMCTILYSKSSKTSVEGGKIADVAEYMALNLPRIPIQPIAYS